MIDQNTTNSIIQTHLELMMKACSTKCYICYKNSHGKNSKFQDDQKISKQPLPNANLALSSLHVLLNTAKFLIYNCGKHFQEISEADNKKLNEQRIEDIFKLNISELRNGLGQN